MKYLFRMFLFDIKMSFRGFMGTYIAVVPLLVLCILRFFIPSMESSSFTVAAVNKGPHAVPQEVLDVLDAFADIKTYDSIEKMERKLRGTGSAEGLYRDPDKGTYVSVPERNPEGNAAFSLTAQVLRQHYYREHYPDAPDITTFSSGVPPELSERTATSPVATMGGAIFLVFMVIVSSFIIGLGVVDDKECGTDRAFLVSPVSKSDYYIGKSIYPLLVILFYTILGLLFLGLMHVNILQVYLLVLLSFSITLLVGLLIGAIAGNENEAIGIGKMLAMIMLFSILGGTLLSDQWQWVVWWSPFYWMYDNLEAILTQTASWSAFAWKSALMLGLCGLYFALLRKKIVSGLS